METQFLRTAAPLEAQGGSMQVPLAVSSSSAESASSEGSAQEVEEEPGGSPLLSLT